MRRNLKHAPAGKRPAAALLALLSAALFGTILVGPSCSSNDSRDSRKNKTRRVPIMEFRPSPDRYNYRGRSWTVREYEKLKKDELERFRFNLVRMYRPKFRFIHDRHFNIAYRCRESQIRALMKSIRIFYEAVYPRYFRYEPAEPIRIIVFKNRREFIRHTGMRVYGSYLPGINTMLTYLGSGAGTLNHELIHAFIKLNTDRRPPEWFNEGFASFHEKTKIRDGRLIVGYTNWRLRRLQAAIATGPVAGPRELMLSPNIAHSRAALSRARFLFCYLWTRGKLKPFVRIYLYELMPKYSGKELDLRAVRKMEELLGKPASVIDHEFLEMARRLRSDERLPLQYRGDSD